jgi:hypothetical protein
LPAGSFFAAKPHFDLLTVQAESKVQHAAVYAVSRYKLKKFLEIPSAYIAGNAAISPPTEQLLPVESLPGQEPAETILAPLPIDELLTGADLSSMPLTSQEEATQ